jgi:ubiquinone/menaquinone biosynthesis C-methylase UbiE
MDKHVQQNQKHWDEITPVHVNSAFYDVAGFKAGKSTMIMPFEPEEMGDVRGKSLLHLQCHFGMDTLTWARLGAQVTGVDFSGEAIKTARKLSKEIGIESKFIESDIYKLPEVLNKKFDIVFTSYGVLTWLPDLPRWANVISHFLKPGGFFYIAEFHPFASVFDNSQGAQKLDVTVPYFHNPTPIEWEPVGDYADPNFIPQHGSAEWMHPIGEIVDGLIGAGLKIEFLHEFPYVCYQSMPFMYQTGNGEWRLEGDPIPLTFSIKATK